MKPKMKEKLKKKILKSTQKIKGKKQERGEKKTPVNFCLQFVG